LDLPRGLPISRKARATKPGPFLSDGEAKCHDHRARHQAVMQTGGRLARNQIPLHRDPLQRVIGRIHRAIRERARPRILRNRIRTQLGDHERYQDSDVEIGDGGDVGCTCVIESLGSFGTAATVDSGKELE
jgi:hypothetical protein